MKLIMAEYSQARNICTDCIGADRFDFCFSYVPAENRFREIDRFLWESRHEMTRFENSYHGPAAVDLTAWSEASPNDYFDAFMYFLKDFGEEGKLIFISEKPCREAILSRLRRFFEIEITDLLEKKEEHHTRKIGFAVQEGNDHVRS